MSREFQITVTLESDEPFGRVATQLKKGINIAMDSHPYYICPPHRLEVEVKETADTLSMSTFSDGDSISIQILQRRFKITYAKASELFDNLVKNGRIEKSANEKYKYNGIRNSRI